MPIFKYFGNKIYKTASIQLLSSEGSQAAKASVLNEMFKLDAAKQHDEP